MPPIVHCDTETSGINAKGLPSDHPSQPRVLSLSAIMDDDQTGKTHRVLYTLINNPGFTIDERLVGDDGKTKTAFAVNGISNAMVQKYGVPPDVALTMLADMFTDPGTTFCAFNKYFDWKMVKIMCAQTGAYGAAIREKLHAHVTGLCTMESAAKHLNGPTQRFIKLTQAHERLCGQAFEGAHNSLQDAYASRRVYQKLKEANYPFKITRLEERVYDTPPPAA